MLKNHHPALLLAGTLLLACFLSGGGVSSQVSEPASPTTLHRAITKGSIEDLRDLVSNGVNLNEREDGLTPLHRAILYGREDVAHILIERGADVNARDDNGRTPLHYAVWQNQTDVASDLLAHEADVDAVDDSGMTVLGAAGYAGSNIAAPTIEPGMVVCIDTEKTETLTLCRKAYDRTTVGIISGAGGIGTGMHLGKISNTLSGEHPIALSGRVYCWTDATIAPIEIGDFLTTSNSLGHAMKATDYDRARGAIVGKAMTTLDSGKGLVLVFVALQ